MRMLLLFLHDRIVFQDLFDKYEFRIGLVARDTLLAFVGFSKEHVFLRTHLISFRVCVGRAGRKLKLCL